MPDKGHFCRKGRMVNSQRGKQPNGGRLNTSRGGTLIRPGTDTWEHGLWVCLRLFRSVSPMAPASYQLVENCPI